MIRRPPRSTLDRSSAASDVYKRQIVTTPQEASLGVVRKGIAMFEKVNVPLLGIVENMSYFTAPNGERVEIFGHGGGRAEAERQKVSFLGEIPLFTEIREGGDQGKPI